MSKPKPSAREPEGETFQRVQFLASFPPIQSAIKIGQDGMRIQFDIPETEMGNAVGLVAMREKQLKVIVEIVDSGVGSKPSEAELHYGKDDGRKR